MALSEESRLLSMRILQTFVRETKGKWGPKEWQGLVQRVRKAGFEKTDEARMRQLLDDNRERWLSGDNSAGPPPPGARAVEPPKKEIPKPAQPVGDKKREEKSMPEAPKGPPPKPAVPPPKPAAAAPKPSVAPPKPAAVAPPKPAAVAPPRPAAAGGEGVKSEAAKSDFVLSSKDVAISSSQAQEMHQRRLALLKRSQDLTKELSDTEVEIRRLENLQTQLQKKLDELEGTRDPLESQRKKLQSEVDECTKEISRLQQAVDNAATQRAELEEEVGRRKKERSEHVAAIAHLKAEKESLIS
jgi:hypothetical protein